MKNELQIFTLSNGLRVVHQQKKSNVIYCGLMIEAGTVDEDEAAHGVAHFLEHVLFKGTKTRSANDICFALEDSGGELNAYTGREDTVVYGIVQKSEFEKTLAIIADLVFNSTFPTAEMEKEKSVVQSEIDSTNCNVSDVIYDKSMSLLFKHNPYGRAVLGTKKSVKSFTRADITNFVKRNYLANRMIFSVVGDVDNDNVLCLAEKYLAGFKTALNKKKLLSEINYVPYKKEFSSDSSQAFSIISNLAYKVGDKRRAALSLLTNLLGGPLFSSKLNLSLREKFGLVYDVSASYEAFSEVGVFQIYFETSKAHLKKTTNLALAELDALRHKKLTKKELDYAKKRFVGQITILAENAEQQMIDNAKSLLLLGRVETLAEQCKLINSVTSTEIFNIANDIFEPSKLSFVSYT